jgi:hypothetical protein
MPSMREFRQPALDLARYRICLDAALVAGSPAGRDCERTTRVVRRILRGRSGAAGGEAASRRDGDRVTAVEPESPWRPRPPRTLAHTFLSSRL